MMVPPRTMTGRAIADAMPTTDSPDARTAHALITTAASRHRSRRIRRPHHCSRHRHLESAMTDDPASTGTPRARFEEFSPYVPSAPALDVADRFLSVMRSRRTVRHFAPTPVPRALIERLVAIAASAPSGANKQPWRFVAVDDPATKREIRLAAEAEERVFYRRRASAEWLADLEHLGTDEHKPFLEAAPWLITVFKLASNDDPTYGSEQVYYTNESVGIAVGFLLAAAHHAGLVTLTHTPSPMKFLGPILRRPPNERPYLLIPIGYPEAGCQVPKIAKKPLEQVLVWNRPAAT
jgi:nitroreductase